MASGGCGQLGPTGSASGTAHCAERSKQPTYFMQ
jgi:hypothetical protein